jgi:hypothetical protein
MSPIEIAVTICVSIVIIVICVALYRYFTTSSTVDVAFVKKPVLISEVVNYPIDGRVTAKLSQVGIEYTYNMWIKITDPGSSHKSKCILYRSSASPADITKAANPSIWLKPDNSLMVRASTRANPNPGTSELQEQLYPTYPNASVGGDNYTIVNPLHEENSANADSNTKTAVCDVNNIPMQRWVQITVVLWNQTMDVYINGKLTRSCILPGMPLHDPDALANVYIGGGPKDNFNGHISRVRYFNHAITATDVMELYKKGPVPVTWWWQTMRNRVKVMLEIGEE